ncbi:acetyltransferase [Clostridium botulinum]|uniref:acetyltransferase n=1 Tax=Clostridium botulinum TaxID=1491 RepID=UPI001C9B74B1|nr:acetyltransferase [Clostridium botulinum]MBY6838844.1 acetyltransferase [Clostridium botulinum]
MSDFKCSNNEDVENFLLKKDKAIRNEKADKTRTHLVVDKDNPYTKDGQVRILGYFSLSTKPLKIPNNISRTMVKQLDGVNKNAKYVECYLIGQLGKNENHKHGITGKELLDKALDLLKQVQKAIGKRVILVESVDNKKVLDFYNDNGFEFIDTIEVEQKDKIIKLHQLILRI